MILAKLCSVVPESFLLSHEMVGKAFIRLIVDVRSLVPEDEKLVRVKRQKDVNYFRRKAAFVWDNRHLFIEDEDGTEHHTSKKKQVGII